MKCKNPAFYRFTWPGRDESYICTEHVNKLKGVASAMGLPLQVIELDETQRSAGLTCNQEVKETTNDRAS